MEVPRLLVDAGLVALSTAAIFVFRKFFRKCRELEVHIGELNKTVKTLHSDEKEQNSIHQVNSTTLEQTQDILTDQHELQIELGDRQEEIQKAIYALTNKVKESQQDTNDAVQKIRKAQEELNDYFLVLDNHLVTKAEQTDTTVMTIFTRWEHQLEPHMNTSDKAHQHHQESFKQVKESFQELATMSAANSHCVINV